ncbi:MAG: 7-carboxy-7-deazaguanine synthase QueE [Candidatus Omnitrophica bacterium]|nr:7-carboxy-7-deazaguanine synthase QueE [Candidatus Omnitrophota bacterium]MCM8807513.1 7-carboxy-7-deazaguanine synthase QueE [Candidatus Omnitrophota bacterium]
MIYRINEIFYSIQGEGLLQGLPFVFIRFTGCNLRCSWCDTKYAWENGKEMEAREILKEVEKFDCKRVCFTGGEPYLQEIEYLFEFLKRKNYWISVETNGTIWRDIKFHWITVSPKEEGKIYHPSGYDNKFKKVANEFKYVIINKKTFEFIDRKIESPVILQPLNNDKKISKDIVNFLKKNPEKNWYFRFQIQKILKIK